ncbi:PREDICTED: GRB2-associated-binding protein 2-like isoform X2 [Ceratosolen solmsi marchali]|uniref:GRB2-associated-binding protein 2-like isoform X2 n=1 Tax=Ceratosolen solmsi marchali TaxID=326594 RepID=A0AAJ6YSN8_9HYME|nr:PREDICTED: GRB2-associated-binding protein 2-like isoform X2 [Ceratosolen solmsi marchali]
MEAFKNQEIVHEGWLIKSPPTKLWRARWRERWFTLRHSGELPDQYFLEYYTDKKCRKLKGKIDLDQCEQVDAGLRFENRKQKYQFMFNVKTPKRTYYLVAKNEADMNKWVDAVCHVCGLKPQDDEQQCQLNSFEIQESPPISPTSTISGPYIPISECISGRSLNDSSSLSSVFGQHYDAPRRLVPSPPKSPVTTDAESVFTDDECMISVPSVHWETFPSTGDSKSYNVNDGNIGSWSVCKRFGKLKIVDSIIPTNVEEISAPPRPPKPTHMSLENFGHNYLNLDGTTESSKPTTPAISAQIVPVLSIITDDTYDFPRSHQPNVVDSSILNKQSQIKHCYTNAAPTNAVDTDDCIFRYDFYDDEPTSSRSESSMTATYSNLSSPLIKCEINVAVPLSSNLESQLLITSTSVIPTIAKTVSTSPPIVYRELKPGRNMNDRLSIISSEPLPSSVVFASTITEMSLTEHSHAEPPSINRKLKPPLNNSLHERPLQLISSPANVKIRTVCSSTFAAAHSNRYQSISDEDNVIEHKEEDQNNFIPVSSQKFVDLQYLDLDLGTFETFNISTLPLAQSTPSSTVYKTVDFLKTEAFNRTRQRVEEERKQCTDGLT